MYGHCIVRTRHAYTRGDGRGAGSGEAEKEETDGVGRDDEEQETARGQENGVEGGGGGEACSARLPPCWDDFPIQRGLFRMFDVSHQSTHPQTKDSTSKLSKKNETNRNKKKRYASPHEPVGTSEGTPHLPREEAPLRVRHDGEVAAVLGAQAGDAVGRAVGVERVGLRRAVGVVHEPVVFLSYSDISRVLG